MLRNAPIWGEKGRKRWLVAAVLAALVAVVGGVAAPVASAQPASSRWIVTLIPGVNPAAVASSVGAADVRTYTEAINGFAASLTEQQVQTLATDDRVESIEPNTIVATRPIAPEGPSTLSAPPPSTQIVPDGIRRVGGLQSPTARIDGRDQPLNADIAVLDGGVDATHQDLRVVGGVNCVGDNVPVGVDLDGHGTEVAGVAAAIDNTIGVVGLAPGARIWSVRIFAADGSLTTESFLCGLDYLRANARRIDVGIMSFEGSGSVSATCGRKVTSLSLFPFRLPRVEVVDPVHSAICRVTAAGVTLVAAAGNGSQAVSTTLPAAYPEVIAVSAFTDTDGRPGGLGPAAACLPTEQDDRFATYSNYGRAVDISAPGTCVLATFLGNSYIVDTGTSFSAPHVAGAAALVKARTPFLPPNSVRAILVGRGEPGPIPGDPDNFPERRLNVRGL